MALLMFIDQMEIERERNKLVGTCTRVRAADQDAEDGRRYGHFITSHHAVPSRANPTSWEDNAFMRVTILYPILEGG